MSSLEEIALEIRALKFVLTPGGLILDVLFSASPYSLLQTTGVSFSLSQNLLPVVFHHKLLGFEIALRRELHTLVHRKSVCSFRRDSELSV